MNRKQFIFTLSMALLSGLMGGVLSIWFLMPPSVLAQGDSTEKQTVEAERFVLRDASGRMRAELSTNGEYPVLWFYDEEGRKGTTVGQDAVLVVGPEDDSWVLLSPDGVQIKDANGDRLRLNPDSLTISDTEGFQAVLGSTGTVETRTGRTNQTSAASLIFFGKNGTVIWRAPDN